jgi:hypothetical protein
MLKVYTNVFKSQLTINVGKFGEVVKAGEWVRLVCFSLFLSELHFAFSVYATVYYGHEHESILKPCMETW